VLLAALGLAIGLALGLLGGGGSVLALPALVGVAGLGVHEATTTSLLVVSAAAIAGGAVQAEGRRVCWPQVATFAPGAVAGTVAGTALNRAAGPDLLLIGFAAVMAVAAAMTWRRARSAPEAAAETVCPPLSAPRTLFAGLAVGALTGFFGVGGGFLVVPLLALALRFGVREAIGTSLVIVAFVSLVGLAAHVAAGSAPDAAAGLAMALPCAAGAIAGARLGRQVSQPRLGAAFAFLVGSVAAAVAVAGALG
jgi:uncharacterized protein